MVMLLLIDPINSNSDVTILLIVTVMVLLIVMVMSLLIDSIDTNGCVTINRLY